MSNTDQFPIAGRSEQNRALVNAIAGEENCCTHMPSPALVGALPP